MRWAAFRGTVRQELQARTAGTVNVWNGAKHWSELLPEAFATVREASAMYGRRASLRRQLMGGMVLNNNQIAEMRQVEG